MVKKTESKQLKLNKVDMKKIGKGLLIAAGGSALTYLLSVLPMIDFGSYALMVVPIASSLVNALLKLLKGKK